MEKIKNFFALRSIRSQIILGFIIAGLFLLGAMEFVLTNSLERFEVELLCDKEASDIQYLEDYLGGGEEGWHIVRNTLYKGYVMIGDGTEDRANIDPFIELEQKTGTSFYAFLHQDYVSPEIKAEIDKTNQTETEYIRVAGSTKNAEGNSIVGTYMDRAVADALNESGEYSGEANVEGTPTFCLYHTLLNDKGETIGAIVVGKSIDDLKSITLNASLRSMIYVIIAIILTIACMLVLISRWIRSINKAKVYLEQIGTGVFPEEPLVINTRDEMAQIADSINEMTRSLQEKERIGAELNLATDIQAHMLPTIFPPFPDLHEFDIYATMNPAKEVGGDFYDFFMIDENNICVVVADVSGKGVPAALYMVIAKTLIKNHMQSGLTPKEVFTKVNQMLCESNSAGLFVTAWAGVLNLETGILTYVNAGHNPPLLKLENGEFEYLKTRHGFVLAGMEGVRYRQNELEMQPGSRLFLYTDGVTEATNLDNQLYGEERLNNYLNAHKTDSPKDTLKGLQNDINAFVGGAEQFDDITMLVLDYQKRKDGSSMLEKSFPATDAALQEVLAFVETELEKLDCPPKTVMQLAIAVEEIFVNIAHYAYGDGTGKMNLGFKYEDGAVSLRFRDRGMPFDPLAKVDPDISLAAEEREIGGLGIYMVKKSMDDVTYSYESGQNILTITKKI